MNASAGNTLLLALWEQVAALPPARRALRLLAGLSSSGDEVSGLSVGERDRRLLLIRGVLFGDRIEGVAACPVCRERVELGFSISVVTREIAVAEPLPVHSGDYEVVWRLPTCQDVADLADEQDPERIRDRLMERCLLRVKRDREVISHVECPRGVIDEVCEAMSLADPYGNMRLGLECPECGHSWKAAFDIGTYLYREIDVWAKRLLVDVHRLASTYGWCESDILLMSAQRRRIYLELAGI